MSDKPGLSVRINLANGGRFGPGKAALLEAISQHGSINKAANALSMSYPRALKLIEVMNGDFQAPLVTSSHGGAARGGSALTVLGNRVLALYRQVENETHAASRDAVETLTGLES
jgi:molybdate transport system regulatory protein